jgi:hypothetical protein
MGADVVIWRILAFPAVAVFFFAYGVLEDMIKKCCPPKRPLDQPKFTDASPLARFPAVPEQPPQVRGYGTFALFCEDALIRLEELYKQASSPLDRDRVIVFLLTVRKAG